MRVNLGLSAFGCAWAMGRVPLFSFVLSFRNKIFALKFSFLMILKGFYAENGIICIIKTHNHAGHRVVYGY